MKEIGFLQKRLGGENGRPCHEAGGKDGEEGKTVMVGRAMATCGAKSSAKAANMARRRLVDKTLLPA